MSNTVQITFDAGTLVLTGDAAQIESLRGCQFDSRIDAFRTEARYYRAIVEELRRRKLDFTDNARGYQPIALTLTNSREPFPHQKEAMTTWWNAGGRGVVVLPTGTGKTLVALLAIAHVGRPALVVTPTIPLMNQWYGELYRAFSTPTGERNEPVGSNPIGLLGGGYHELQPLTVTT